MPRTARPPYSHVENSTCAQPDKLGRTTLRAMVHVEPYGSSDLGGNLSDHEMPSLLLAAHSKNHNPDYPENPSGKKKKKNRRSRRQERRRSKEAKSIATCKIVVNLPDFMGKDLSDFAKSFCQFLRITIQTRASGRVPALAVLQD